MNTKNMLNLLGFALLGLLIAVPLSAQGQQAKSELNIGTGTISITYGQPALGGQDRVAEQKVGDFWRMGKNQATVIVTPVDLSFGSVKVPKGSYSLFLLRETPEKYMLVFNSQTGQWGTQHDPSKDVFKAPLQLEKITNSVELFTIDLKKTAGGGQLVLTWGTSELLTDFQFAQ